MKDKALSASRNSCLTNGLVAFLHRFLAIPKGQEIGPGSEPVEGSASAS